MDFLVSSTWFQRLSDDYCRECRVEGSQREANRLLYWPYRIPECQSQEGLLSSFCPTPSCLKYTIRVRDMKWLGQSPIASEWQSWDWNSRWQTLVSLLWVFFYVSCSCPRAVPHMSVPTANTNDRPSFPSRFSNNGLFSLKQYQCLTSRPMPWLCPRVQSRGRTSHGGLWSFSVISKRWHQIDSSFVCLFWTRRIRGEGGWERAKVFRK